MSHYEVHLKEVILEMPISADKFICEPGFVVFYSKSESGGCEEVARFKSSNVARIKEM